MMTVFVQHFHVAFSQLLQEVLTTLISFHLPNLSWLLSSCQPRETNLWDFLHSASKGNFSVSFSTMNKREVAATCYRAKEVTLAYSLSLVSAKEFRLINVKSKK